MSSLPLPHPPPDIPTQALENFQRLLAFPLDTQERMVEALDRYLATVRGACADHPSVDLPLAEKIAARLRELLAYDAHARPELHQQWIQAAARYFFLSDDASHDWESPEGFRDDAEVVSAVARATGQPELALQG